jgi:hypothetical protein
MEDTVILAAKWALCSGVGCLLGMWLQGKLSALWGAIRSDRSSIAQLWDRNAEDRKLIGDLQRRVEELEAKFKPGEFVYADLDNCEVINMQDIYNSIDTNWAPQVISSIEQEQ